MNSRSFTTAAAIGWAFTGLIASASSRFAPFALVTLEERYDDDRLFQIENGGKGQFISKVSPQLGFQLDAPTLTVRPWYAADIYERRLTTLKVDHRGELMLKKQFFRRFSTGALLKVWRVTDPTTLPRLGLARTLSPVLYGTAKVEFSQRLTRLWEIHPVYRFEGAQVDEFDPSTGVNRPPGFYHSPSIESWWTLSARSAVGVEYRFQQFNYGQDTAHSQGGFVDLRYFFTPQVSFTAKAGPALYSQQGTRDSGSGVLPRVYLELILKDRWSELNVVAGHDLVGASGFTSVVWANFASAVATFTFYGPFSLFGEASFFSNGKLSNSTLLTFQSPDSSKGYVLGGGVEFKVNNYVKLQGAFLRIAQFATANVLNLNLDRNVGSVRLVLSAW